jgi:hypothetical protein
MATNVNVSLRGVPRDILQENIILPAQHFAPRQKQAPEQRLMIAVLQDAINCVEKYRIATDRRGRRLFDEVKQWLLAEETNWPFSFECICEVLGLESSAVRHQLQLAPMSQDRFAPRQMRVTRQESRSR